MKNHLRPTTAKVSDQYTAHQSMFLYWQHIAEKSRARNLSEQQPQFETDLKSCLGQWDTLISMHLSEDKRHVYLCHRNSQSPSLLLQIPINRHTCVHESIESSFECHQSEFKTIISKNNVSIAEVKDVKSALDRAAWWQTRLDLDKRLELLMSCLESSWFGAFRVSAISAIQPIRVHVHSISLLQCHKTSLAGAPS